MSCAALSDTSRSRIGWVDAARALCVLAVVVMHTTISLLLVSDPDPLDMTWRRIVDAMTPLRMPALALLSGMLLARRIRAGWGDRSVRASIALSYWLYAVWLLVFLLVARLVGWAMWLGPFGQGTTLGAFQAYIDQLVLPRSVLWYVLALAIWTAVLTAIHRVPPAAVLIVLGAISIVTFYLPADGSDQYRNVLRYFVFFAVGVYCSTEIRDRITRQPWVSGAVAAGVFAVVTFIAAFGIDGNVGNVLTVPRDIAGALLVMVAAVALRFVPFLGRTFSWIGRRTLPIYVMHIPLLELLTMSPGWWIGALDNQVVRAIAPVVITLAITVVTVAIHEAAIRTPARVIFVLPDAWRHRILEGRRS